MIKTLQQYLLGKIIYENHPKIEHDLCTNSKQRRRLCTVCRDVCPKSVIGNSSSVQWENCENCNICVAQCPSRAIRPSAINISKLLEILDSKSDQVVIACTHREAAADFVLHCIASVPWEVIVCLALEKQVILLKQDCDSCQEGCMAAFEKAITRVAVFLGAELFEKQIRIVSEEELPPPVQMSRREMFSLMGKKAKNAIGSVLPEDGSVEIDGMLFRKLLSKRLKLASEQDGGQTYGWYTLNFSKECWGCGICAKVCPHRAITIVDSDEKKYMAHDLWKCEGCGICKSVCLEKGLLGMSVAYVTNPLEPVLTEINCSACKLCGGPVQSGTGDLCRLCRMEKRT